MKQKIMLGCNALMAAAMATDMAALHLKIESDGMPSRKDEGTPTLIEIKEAQDNIGKAFEAFQAKNDQRLKQIEEKGTADPITREELAKIEAELLGLKSVRDDLEKLMKKAARPGDQGGPTDLMTLEQKEHRDAFLTMLRDPNDEAAKATVQQLQKKAVSTTTDGAGGYAVPEIIAAAINRTLRETSGLRQIVHVVTAGSKDYKELIDVGGLGYGWVGEGDTRTETATDGLQEIAPTFGTLYAYPKASEESLDDIFFDVEAWLQNSIAEGFLKGEENAIVNGNGVKKPTGFLSGTPVATADASRAFGVLQYIASGAAAAMTDPDVLINLVQTLKRGHRSNGRFLMNKLTTGAVMKLKDGDGNYLWSMGNIQSGQPDRLLGYPVTESEEMPDIAANAFPIGFGDMKAGYLLTDLVNFRLTRDEVTTPGYVKWYARRRLGGNIRDSEAIKLLKIAAT